MKILHCCLANYYIDNYGYQENILPKMHKLQGHEVAILASTETFVDNNNVGYIEPKSYCSEDGIPITRLPYSKLLLHSIMKTLRMYKGISIELEKFKPKIIFLHGFQFLDIKHFVKYAKKNPDVKIFIDSHADYFNSARSWFSRNILHKIIYRHCAKIIEPYTTRFYGVLPARVDFLMEIYKLPKEKVELLVMGAEDDKVQQARSEKVKREVRDALGIGPEDFLIVTGGKIDATKKHIFLLMEAVHEIPDKTVKLIVFGSIAEDLKDSLKSLSDGKRVQYIGWMEADQTYRYFAAADLVVFPGTHSVFWEQVVGLGIPIIVKYFEGMTHIDAGGNCVFLYQDSVQEIRDRIIEIQSDREKFAKMKKVAEEIGMQRFSYKEIAKRAIEG